MKHLILIGLLSFLAIGCQDDEIVEAPENLHKVALEFELTFEGAPFVFSPNFYTLSGGERVRFTRIKWLFSGVRFENNTDSLFATIPYAYFSPQDNVLSAEVTFPKDWSTAARFAFEVGVDTVANHADPNNLPAGHPLHPMVNQLHWGWAEGYVFALIEGFEDTPGGELPIVYHIGFVENIQTASFELPGETLPQILQFELKVDEVFKAPTPFILTERGRFTHSFNDGGIARDLSENFSNAIELK